LVPVYVARFLYEKLLGAIITYEGEDGRHVRCMVVRRILKASRGERNPYEAGIR
jgi:hypothetical protein